MNPQTNPGTPVQPAATTQSAQGVTAVAPTAPATAPALPQPSAPGALPAPLHNPTLAPASQTGATIANFYKIPGQTADIVNAGQSTGKQAGQQFAGQQFEAGVKEQNLKDQLDPSKYTITNDPKSQYGVKITNSVGNPVDLSTYVNLTGQNPAQVLQNSTDPNAQKFVTAYTNFENLMKTKIAADQGDEQAQIQLGDYYKANPGLQNMSLQQVTSAFMNQYGQFFGQPQQQTPTPQGVSPTFASADTPIASSPYYEMQYYPQLATPNPISSSLLSGGSSTPNNNYSAIAANAANMNPLGTGG